ncbi:DciA family protein [Streptomyces hokutonensis]|uniref:DciA family protein n=1 Tax=Streptomyces hokutonensis TaxID=1306990 RepID=UPI000377377B|nr:DciA family protein [Streptomyces hokutonensis]
MTETINPTAQTGTTTPEVSGVDLARVALRQAKEAAKKRGDSEARAPRRRQHTSVRRDGREPSGFAAVLQGLMADRAWELPAAGGTVLDRWPDIAAAISPKLPSHVTAVAYNPAARQLDLRPDSPAYATQLRLITARIIATVNSAVGTDAVRTIRVLPAGAAPRTHPAPEAAATPGAPVKTRETASAGYHQALAAHQSAAPPSRIDPGIAEAVDRQTRRMRELSRRAFPEPPDDAPTAIETARAERRRQAAATEAAARRRARQERADRQSGTSADAPESTSLRTTA